MTLRPNEPLHRSALQGRRGWLALGLAGAASFWLPAIFLQLLRASRFNFVDVLCLTVALPLCAAGVLLLLLRLVPGGPTGVVMGWLMVAGAWVLGPTLIMAAATLSGGGFTGLLDRDADHGWFLTVTAVPFSTFILATYDGTLLALLLVTCLLPAWGWAYDRRHKAHIACASGDD